MLFIAVIAGFWLASLAVVVCLIAFIVCLVLFLRVKKRLKTSESAAAEELPAAKRRMITCGLVLLLLLAADLVCLTVASIGLSSM